MIAGSSGLSARAVVWKLPSLSWNIASTRYRALLPALGLDSVGIRSIFTASARIDLLLEARALVIVKSFSQSDVFLAEEAKRRNVPVFFDLCDNIFVPGYRGKSEITPAAVFDQLLPLCSAVIVPTAALRDVLRLRFGAEVRIVEISDCVESVAERAEAIALFERSCDPVYTFVPDRVGALARVKAILRPGVRRIRAWLKTVRSGPDPRESEEPTGPPTWRTTSRPLILWFGNSGNTYTKSGLGDLRVFASALRGATRGMGAELLVLSNARAEFEALAFELDLRAHYDDWSLSTMESALQRADVVIVPNSSDEFSVCKSPNRALLAISRGVPVVATPTRALHDLCDVVWQGDALTGMRQFITDRAMAKEWVGRALPKIQRLYSVSAVGRAWQSALDSFALSASHFPDNPNTDILFTIGLVQDVDIIAPIVRGARERNIGFFVYVALSVAQGSQRVARYLAENEIPYAVLPDKFDSDLADALMARHRAAIFPSETSLNPHLFSHRLCKFARRAGRPTFTIQHGIENVGLTYSDEIHDIRDILILSRTIFLWGNRDTLHPNAAPDVQARSLPVGCPKPLSIPAVPIPALLDATRPMVGIFENLHWHRYSDSYRDRFMQVLQECVRRLPQVLFLIKPHNAGMWLTSRFDGVRPEEPNVIVADPSDPLWENYTAPQLLGHLRCVVTTPSTVALDSARAGLPTAVMRFDADVDRYSPLTMIDSSEDLANFVVQSVNGGREVEFSDANCAFIARHVIGGDATERILAEVTKQIDMARRSAARRACISAT